MSKEVLPRIKLRTVLTYGSLKREENNYLFRASPLKDCPILEMKHKSKWAIIEEVYNAIRYYD